MEDKKKQQPQEAAKEEIKKKQEHEDKVEDKALDKQKESGVPITKTVAKQDAEAEVNAEESEKLKKDIEAGKIKPTIQPPASDPQWLIDEHGRRTNPNDVKFQVKYSSKYKQEDRHMPEEIIVVSQEVADQFESLGIGHIIK